MGHINLFAPGHLDLADSYGLLSLRMAEALESQGHVTNLYWLGENRAGADIAGRPRAVTFGGVLFGYPKQHKIYGPLVRYGPRVLYTMWESTKLPPSWLPDLEQYHVIVVPSKWTRDVFEENGVKQPIHVISPGIEQVYQPFYRPVETRDVYTFLTIGDRGWRKGFDVAALAFSAAFGDDLKYRLVIKCREDTPMFRILNPNIQVIQQDLDSEGMYKLYCDADCMLFSSRGEGFGLPPREFAATGGPAVVTNWGGLSEQVELYGIPLDYTLVPAQGGIFDGMGNWAEPNRDHLIWLLGEIVANKAQLRNRAYESAKIIRATWNWENAGRLLWDAWEEACERWQHQQNNMSA